MKTRRFIYTIFVVVLFLCFFAVVRAVVLHFKSRSINLFILLFNKKGCSVYKK